MDELIRLHASPKPLLRFLLTTKQLCKPRFKLYKTVVKPFLQEYNLALHRTLNHLEKRVEKIILPRRYPADDRTPFMLVDKWKQIHDHIHLIMRFHI